jgi:hypothetical protein
MADSALSRKCQGRTQHSPIPIHFRVGLDPISHSLHVVREGKVGESLKNYPPQQHTRSDPTLGTSQQAEWKNLSGTSLPTSPSWHEVRWLFSYPKHSEVTPGRFTSRKKIKSSGTNPNSTHRNKRTLLQGSRQHLENVSWVSSQRAKPQNPKTHQRTSSDGNRNGQMGDNVLGPLKK